MTLSQLALGDVEALYSGTLFLTADPMGPLLDQDDEEEALSPSSSLEGKVPPSPPLSFSSYPPSPSAHKALLSTPPFSASPPPSPPPHSLSPTTKAREESLFLPWMSTNSLLDAQVGADDGKDDAFVGMEWMTEKIDLSELDLDSLIGSCSSDDSPSSPEDLLASLDSQMDLDIDSFDTAIPTLNTSLELGLSLPSIHSLPLELPIPGAEEAIKTEGPPPQEVLKSEPLSPAPSPAPSPSLPSPDDTLELGSEVDVPGAEKMALSITAAITPDPGRSIQSTTPIVLSLPPTIVVVLANKEEHPQISLSDQSTNVSSQSSDWDSDSGIESIGSSPTRLPSPPSTPSPTAGSSRTKPYSKPQATAASTTAVKISKVKLVSGAPKLVEKKLKKMEQNKTAATRYRQKKRFEQEKLSTELEGLEKRNSELTEKAESISREIKYLKDLMEEVRKHRRGKTSSVIS